MYPPLYLFLHLTNVHYMYVYYYWLDAAQPFLFLFCLNDGDPRKHIWNDSFIIAQKACSRVSTHYPSCCQLNNHCTHQLYNMNIV